MSSGNLMMLQHDRYSTPDTCYEVDGLDGGGLPDSLNSSSSNATTTIMRGSNSSSSLIQCKNNGHIVYVNEYDQYSRKYQQPPTSPKKHGEFEESIIKKKRGRPPSKKPVECSECKTTSTPEWRRGPNGESLCNACGLQFAKKMKKEKECKIRHSVASLLNENITSSEDSQVSDVASQ
eukprot:gene13848-16328_t